MQLPDNDAGRILIVERHGTAHRCNDRPRPLRPPRAAPKLGAIPVHELQADRVCVVLDLLGEPVRQAGEAAYPRSHREVLTLDVAGGEQVLDGIASDLTLLDRRADCGRARVGAPPGGSTSK